MSNAKPFSQACENNKQPILNHLKTVLQDSHDVLEVGSGTGQHAVYFSAHMPWLLWLAEHYDAIFTANTLHIMGWPEVELFFAKADKHLKATALLCIYGPFKYRDEFTSPSNADFDLWLKGNNPVSGIRDFEAIERLAHNASFSLLADHNMPANNQLLVWQRRR